jgi:dimeric dUTPase (all-alpha-NTP-PPase superfamily)
MTKSIGERADCIVNLTKLFEMQNVLDEHIMDEHPELKGQDNLEWKVLALLVEAGECANEWRGFKKWSKDQAPKTWELVEWRDSDGEYHTKIRNPLLEEYVDGLHFNLSIGNELGIKIVIPYLVHIEEVGKMYLKIYKQALILLQCGSSHKEFYFAELISNYLGLGKALGFTWEEIEQAYFAKNAVNHQRQESGY